MWIVLVAALFAVSDVSEGQTRVVQLPPDKPLSIDITNGTIRIIGADRKDVEIVVERRGPTAQDLLRLPLVIDDQPDRVHVSAIQTNHTTDAALRADVTVRVPRTARIESVKVMEGRIAVEQFSGLLTADIRRGHVDGKDLSGKLRLTTEIGNVTLTNTRLSPDGVLRLRAFNGDVKLTLAQRPPDARIMALALNGQVKSDIPLTHRNTWGPRWAEATLGRGEPVISIDVVTGMVEIKSP